jgi:ribosomal protein S18 acetylase RimI-like enzyme
MSDSDMVQVRQLDEFDRAWMAQTLAERWGSTRMVSRGVLHEAEQLPGFVAERSGARVGLLTYRIAGGECEVTSLDSLVEGFGVGSALMAAAQDAARAAGCQRLWLITTNDNTHALRFYQRRGLRIAAVYVNAVEISRRIKPEIPLIGYDGIPLRDEIELEVIL